MTTVTPKVEVEIHESYKGKGEPIVMGTHPFVPGQMFREGIGDGLKHPGALFTCVGYGPSTGPSGLYVYDPALRVSGNHYVACLCYGGVEECSWQMARRMGQ